jgi:glutathione S-transferase
MIDFNGSTLYISPRSPFARRVRIAFRENKINYEEKILDVFNLPPGFDKINPVSRIPAVVLKNGEIIIDSNSILRVFYDGQKENAQALKWSGVALGICETLVARYIEQLRPEDKRDPETLAEYDKILKTCLSDFEAFIDDRDFISDAGLTQGDLDMGTAAAYFGLRYDPKWAQKYPKTFAYAAKLNTRPSFQSTIPPAV